MKRLLLITGLLCSLLVPATVVVGSASAVDVIDPVCKNADPNNLPTVCKENATGSTDNPIFGPNGVLTKAISILARLIGVAAVIGIIVAGFKMVTSGGDTAAAKTGRSMLIYSIIGLVVALLAQGIVSFILSRI
jgi:hypothetical protein